MRFKLPWTNRAQPPAAGYDQWSDSYDHEPDNLMIALDTIIFSSLLDGVSITAKTIADVGCGTGRNWPLLLERGPTLLMGYDVSRGMLNKLRSKYPDAALHLISDHRLTAAKNASVDLVVSTLALAHFPDPGKAFREWDRVLKAGGDILFTDYHPDALEHGGTITFAHGGGRVQIQHHIHTLAAIRAAAKEMGWKEIVYLERKIDSAVRSMYEQQNALALYKRFEGKPIIYGIHFRKS